MYPDNSEMPPETLIGTPSIGNCEIGSNCIPIRIPEEERDLHIGILGSPGTGKTTLMENMICGDIAAGNGVIVIDPHGDLVTDILKRIPKSEADRVILLNPGDPDWVPLWNILERDAGQPLDQTVDQIVSALHTISEATGWGARMAHLLRECLTGLLHIPGSRLSDIEILLGEDSPERRTLEKQIRAAVDTPNAKRFWKNERKAYKAAEVSAVKHKLSPLTVGGTIGLMVSQPYGKIHLREVMDQKKILLVDLSSVGLEVQKAFGGILLALIHVAALGRSRINKVDRIPCHVYCDECHLMTNDALEHLLNQARKFRVRLILASQRIGQFTKTQQNALASVGSLFLFRQDRSGAQVLAKDLFGKFSADDLVNLNPYETVCRIGTDVLKLKTHPPCEVSGAAAPESIVERAHNTYCLPVDEARKAAHYDDSTTYLQSPAGVDLDKEDFSYDEF